ncbi:MAG: iron ABC transporter permease [Phycisphaerales bacterium]|nr:iron ABC transporter permease [Phycisphaerales bacterium]
MASPAATECTATGARVDPRRPDAGRRTLLLAAGCGGAVALLVAATFVPRLPVAFEDPLYWELWRLRALRVALAAVVGGGLALGGAVYQALLRNALAEPYTLGVSSGAALGAAAGFLLGVSGTWLWLPKLSLLALAGALTALAIIFTLARARAAHDVARLLLAGVCVSYVASAGILLAAFLLRRPVTNDLLVWMVGSLGVYRASACVEIAVVLGVVGLLAIRSHRELDLLSLGESLAATRGVAVGRIVWVGFAAVGVLTAVIVANCGPIGFVGLIVPHIVRGIVGVRTLPVLVGSLITGAVFLAACDALARSVAANFDTPVGIFTNIIGAGVFCWLLLTRAGSPARA